jgi:structure-specific recognition protein 1
MSAKPRSSKHAPDEMVEVRFYVPGTRTKEARSDAGSQKSDAEDGEEISAAQAFHDAVKERAELGQATGDIILSFEEVLVLTPRGRYDVDMYHEFFRLRGKTYDYKIIYTTISKLFLLPKDDLHVLFIVRLQLSYTNESANFRLAWFRCAHPAGTDQVSISCDAIQSRRGNHSGAKHDRVCEMRSLASSCTDVRYVREEVGTYDRLKKHYEDPTFEVVSGIFRALSKKKIVGSGSFQR